MEIRSRTLEYYETFTSRDEEGDRRQGRFDAQNNKPDATATDFSAHERDIMARTQHDLSAYAAEYQENSNRLVENRDAKQQKVAAYNGERDNLLKAQRTEVEALINRKGEGSSLYKELKAATEEATDRFRSMRKNLGRPLQSYMSKRIYFVVFFFLALAELPINLPAAQVVFAESLFTAFIITVAIGFVLIFLAHYLGKQVRQWRFHTGIDNFWHQRIWFWLGLASVVFMSALLIWGIYFMRIRYLETLLRGDATDSSLFFLIINIGLYVTEFIFSLLYHDPHPDYQQANIDNKAAAKEFAKVRNEYEIEREAIIRRHSETFQELDGDHERLRQEVATIEMDLINLERLSRRNGNLILDVMARRVFAYQKDNEVTRNRLGIDTPKYFGPDSIGRVKDEISIEWNKP